MKAKNFKKINVQGIISNFDVSVMDQALLEGSVAYNHNLPSEIHSAADILSWHIQKNKPTFRKRQLFQIWKKIAHASAGPGYSDKKEYPKFLPRANKILAKRILKPFALKF